ncbi:MAG: hypothetical protein HYZ45_12735 [Burkholderiales bacterium]|nr:hypothetical protein [Burkholderiales bacterium]
MDITIKLVYENTIILECDHVSGFPPKTLDPEEDYEFEVTLLGFYNIRIINPIKIKKKNPFSISYYNNEKRLEEIEFYSIKTIDFGSWRSQYHSELFNCLNNFDYLKMKILTTWVAGFQHVSWKNFDSANKKSSWLLACLTWRGLPEDNTISNQEIELYGAEIKYTEDLYCMFAEAVYGYGGYIGQCLYGFSECVEYIAYKEKKKLTIFIYDYDKLADFFATLLPDHLYEKSFLEILEKAGHIVIK